MSQVFKTESIIDSRDEVEFLGINPSGVSMDTDDSMIISLGVLVNETSELGGLFGIFMRKVRDSDTDTYQVALLVSYGNDEVASQWYDLTDLTSDGEGWSAIEIEYLPGQMSLWVDGALKETLNAPGTNGNSVYAFLLGAFDMNQAASGTIAFDDFEARRNSYIGLLADRSTHVEPGMTNKIYSYADETHVHAVTGVTNGTNSDTYQYDANGKTLALAARAGDLPGGGRQDLQPGV